MKISPAIFFLTLLFAYLIRIIYPDLYIGGGDMPGHIMASFRLYLTSPWEKMLINNSFVQLITFNHGYTTMLFPYLFYFVFFGLLNLPVTEENLVYIHSFIGILSLISMTYFLSLLFPKKIALMSLLIIALAPIHIGLSRAHVGTQIIQSIFFYLSLSFLYLYLTQNKNWYKFGYFLATFFYLGSDNAFVIGLFLQLVFIYLMNRERDCQNKTIFINLYFNMLTVVFIALPIAVYLLTGYILTINKVGAGFLGRLLSKTSHINLLAPLAELIRLTGPVGLLISLYLFKLSRILKNTRVAFLLIAFLVYYGSLALTSPVEGNYVFYLLLPASTLLALFLSKSPALAVLLIFTTLFYSLSAVYSFNIGITTPKNYGSINYNVKNNDYGIKTLGYLVRKNILPVSRLTIQQYGVATEKIGLFLDYEGAFYYLGSSFFDWPERDIRNEILDQYPKNFLVYMPNSTTKRNLFILKAANEKDYYLWGKVTTGQKILLELYSSTKSDKTAFFDTAEYNPRFDREFGNLDFLPKIWLGYY